MDKFSGVKGPRVVLIPDWFVDPSEEWANQVQMLAGRFRVLLFPLHGSRPDDPLIEAPGNANEKRLVHILTGADQPIRIIAHGISCHYALRMAALFPAKVESLVLISPRIHYWEYRKVFRFVAFFPRLFVPFFLMLFDPLGERRGKWSRVRSRLSALPAKIAASYLREMAESNIHPLLEQITCNVFLIAGDRDPWNAAHFAEEMNEELRSSQLIRYANLGHNPHREEPDLVDAALEEFLRETPGIWTRGLHTLRELVRALLGR